MAMVKCPDCGKDVSAAAPSCPNCGRPLRAAQVTIQKTAKTYKAQSVIAFVLFIVGVIMLFKIVEDPAIGMWGMLLVFVGVIWTITVKVKIWWHHK